MRQDSKIYVAGHRGLVGSALVRSLQKRGFSNILSCTHSELDLTDQHAVAEFFASEQPRYVLLAAAKVGGIQANSIYRAEFIYTNLMIQANILHYSYLYGVDRLLFLGSSCIYPKICPQPIKEEYLMTGPLEETNSPYAVAKIAGVEMCWAYNRQYGCRFIPVMPTNLYGSNDSFDLENSHVLPALIRKFHLAKLATLGDWAAIRRDEARFGPLNSDIESTLGIDGELANQQSHQKDPEVVVWGSGMPRREFLHVDDLADACVHILSLPEPEFVRELSGQEKPLVNIGAGTDCSIAELAQLVKEVVGFAGAVVFDSSKPDGTPQKLLDITKVNRLGWHTKISLRDGIEQVYEWYKQQVGEK